MADKAIPLPPTSLDIVDRLRAAAKAYPQVAPGADAYATMLEDQIRRFAADRNLDTLREINATWARWGRVVRDMSLPPVLTEP